MLYTCIYVYIFIYVYIHTVLKLKTIQPKKNPHKDRTRKSGFLCRSGWVHLQSAPGLKKRAQGVHKARTRTRTRTLRQVSAF